MRKIFFLALILNSCGLVNHKRFTYYKQIPKIEQSFRTDGVYFKFKEFHGVNVLEYWANLFFFYRDGTFTSTTLTMKNSTDKDILPKLSNEFYKNIEASMGIDGAYLIIGDSLNIQMFASTQQRGIYSLDVIEQYFFVNKADNSMDLIHSFCNWCPKNEKIDFGEKIVNEHYNFLPLTNKPDSSKLWFKKTKWYKEGFGNK